MVALTARSENTQSHDRLTMQIVDLGDETIAIRSLDWDRDRFDIEFGLDNGTTYNSFLIQSEKTALIDTSHRKFQQLYLDVLKGLIDFSTLDYLIISHTEPDHSGLVKEVLQLAPQVTVVGAKVAIQFLENMIHQPFQSLIVKNGDRLDLGNGHELEFVSAPNLHWPDTIFTYDPKTRILFTCDAFGMHYCDDHTFDEDPELLEADFKYYYDCLMAPNARSVLSAIKRMEKLDIGTIATGHGPLLQHHLSDWVSCYQKWSQEQAKTDTLVALFYCEDYGFCDQLARAIAHGVQRNGVAVELVDLNTAEPQEVREFVNQATGLVIGMPSQSNQNAHAALSTILAAAHRKQAVGLFESGGREDEPIYPLRNKFQEIGLTEAFPPILVKEPPTHITEQMCDEAGTDIGQWLTRDRTIKQIKAIDNDLERALGRLSSGLYIMTAQKADVTSAMLASWVMQASMNPLGVAIAVAKDRAIESLLHIGDRFVLNVLEEDNYQTLMKHFLKRFSPGADRFANIKTYPASNNCPILADALAYMECKVTTRIECSDHWIIYSSVQTGRVAKLDAFSAVHHRKVGNHY
ncbi:diflavin flavoprotein A [Brasilonema octagenarum UFV-E1]|uniref:Diflavin flavoprotein A n=1 Tax=Brasilonema sennae CENA114 TaxID=415709 RepID=A0A856MHY1_9CYAN|nr:diflavin flavoprotein [Brasilonema sennae]QDL09830.1 diflavin flavoprotein A [Brasilonema sennae CENA114]QDL16183.1 diflavin flavoprotein A [Brasilonema octagenarum UFV-E1]